jgi:thioredoxin
MENVSSEELIKLQASGHKLLVDFWAPWCGPCKQLIPRLESLESKYTDVKFVKLNVDENADFSLNLNIRAVPTVIIYDGEHLVSRISGVNQDSTYTNILESL